MNKNHLKTVRPLLSGSSLPALNITGLTIVLTCMMLILIGASGTPSSFGSRLSDPPLNTATTNRCFNGKMCIGPDMMYSSPRQERPVLLANGIPALRMLSLNPPCDPCTE